MGVFFLVLCSLTASCHGMETSGGSHALHCPRTESLSVRAGDVSVGTAVVEAAQANDYVLQLGIALVAVAGGQLVNHTVTDDDAEDQATLPV